MVASAGNGGILTNLGSPFYIGSASGKGSAKGVLGAQTTQEYLYEVTPIALDADGISVAQAVAGAGNLTITGALASGGVATFDVARAVSVTSSDAGDTTQTATITGTDYWGVPLVETIAFNGAATISGKKAFKTVTRIAISAALTGNGSAGTLDIIGLPYRSNTRNNLRTAYDGAQVTTGTYVAAVTTTATATTGDVRGTFLPASATDGVKILSLYITLVSVDSNNGLYGVDQYGG